MMHDLIWALVSIVLLFFAGLSMGIGAGRRWERQAIEQCDRDQCGGDDEA